MIYPFNKINFGKKVYGIPLLAIIIVAAIVAKKRGLLK